MKNILAPLLFTLSGVYALNVQAFEATPDETNFKNAINTTAELKAKLRQLKHFSGDFKQEVIDEEGHLLQSSTGNIKVSQPNLINWHTQQPEETLIISDGDNVWLYDPFVEQASVYTLSASVANTPILLLTSIDDDIWSNYQINKESETSFRITPLNENSRIKSLNLTFISADSYQLKNFTMVDSSGQVSKVTLANVNYEMAIAAEYFQFTPPVGVDIDDQR